MNLPLPEIHVGVVDAAAPELPLASDAVPRYVWHSRFGDMLVEVRDGESFVNGQRVEKIARDDAEKST